MPPEDLQSRFLELRTWSANGRRAPHKPLLLLWAIGRCLRGEARLAPFEEVDEALRGLLHSFGPHRNVVHPEYPFWRLQADQVWQLDRPELVDLTPSKDARPTSLMRHGIKGGLLVSDYHALRANPGWALRVAHSLTEAHFPESYWDDILTAVGIVGVKPGGSDLWSRDFEDGYVTGRRRKRHPGFRPAVLAAYGGRCAVCEFAVQVAGRPAALDAAHIHWLKAAGPWDVRNGLALCVLHHNLFDRGAFTLTDALRVEVSARATGPGHPDSLGRFHGERLRALPKAREHRPDDRFLQWHRTEVFQAGRV